MRASTYQFFQILPGKLREEGKRLHMIRSFWLPLAAHFLRSAQWAFAAVFLIGFAKECWDSRFDSDFVF